MRTWKRKMCNQLHMTSPGDVHTEAMSILSTTFFRGVPDIGCRETGPPGPRGIGIESTLMKDPGRCPIRFVKDR